jgi:hypothetical protein
MDLAEAVELGGGAADSRNLPVGFPKEMYERLSNTVALLQAVIDRTTAAAGGRRVSIVITQSPSLVCRARELGEGHAVVIVPLGLAARVRVQARLLLRYWEREAPSVPIIPLLDTIPIDSFEFPPVLEPLYTDNPDDEAWWRALSGLDQKIDLREGYEPDVWELLHLSVVHLVLHELAHVLRGHFELRRRASSGDVPHELRGLDPAELYRGLELDADWWAARTEIQTLLKLVQAFHQNVALGMMRLAYAVPLVLGLYDAQRKYVHFYKDDAYLHPVIRREVISDGHREQIKTLKRKLIRQWDEMEPFGSIKCVEGYIWLTWDSYEGKFGEPRRFKGDPSAFLPVTAMTKSFATTPTWSQDFLRIIQWKDEALALLARVRDCLG